jgi:hypothetical protein
VFDFLFKILLGRFNHPEFVVGVLQTLPVPVLKNEMGDQLGKLALGSIDIARRIDQSSETSHIFHLPALLRESGETLADKATAWQTREADAKQQLAELQQEIDAIAFCLYGVDGEDRRAIEASGGASPTSDGEQDAGEVDEEADTETATDRRSLVVALVSYRAGAVWGRWDVRYSTHERVPPDLPDPFATLPVCSPGILQGSDGLPLRVRP